MKGRQIFLSKSAAKILSKQRQSVSQLLERTFEVLRHRPEQGIPLCSPLERCSVVSPSPGIKVLYTYTKKKLSICSLHVARLIQQKHTNRFGAVVLAAGKGYCCGKPEQLAPTSKGPALNAALNSIIKASIENIVLVIGFQSAKVSSNLLQDKALHTATLVNNKNYEGPLSQSLKIGLKVLEPGIDGFFLCLGNRPTIKPDTIRRMIDTFKKERPLAIRPWFDCQPGHPVLFDSSMYNQLTELTSQMTPRHVLDECTDVLNLKVNDPGVLKTVSQDCVSRDIHPG